MEAGEEGGEVIIGVSVWGDEVNVGASYTLCEKLFIPLNWRHQKDKKNYQTGGNKKKEKEHGY